MKSRSQLDYVISHAFQLKQIYENKSVKLLVFVLVVSDHMNTNTKNRKQYDKKILQNSKNYGDVYEYKSKYLRNQI